MLSWLWNTALLLEMKKQLICSATEKQIKVPGESTVNNIMFLPKAKQKAV